MMNFKTAVAGAGFAMAMMLASTSAQALTFTTTGTTGGFLPANYNLTPDVLGVNAGDAAQFATNAGSGLGIDGPANLTFTFLGSDAGFTNTFEFVIGTTRFTNASTEGTSTIPIVQGIATSLLDFGFRSNGGALLTNGQGATPLSSMAFVMISSLSYLILYNDNGSTDADYDDMAILVEATAKIDAPPPEVPLPGALPLLLGGLLGLVGLGRRRKAA